MNRPIHTLATLRHIETLAGQAGMPLMDRAAGAIADRVEQRIVRGEPILALAGRGNNGGDALLAAARLAARGHRVDAWLPLGEPATDDARRAHAQALAAGVTLVVAPRTAPALALDGLFGIGLRRAPDAAASAAIDWLNGISGHRLALDVPSGLDAWSGRVTGCAVAATETLTFLADKPGLLTHDGPDQAGEVHLATLDIPPAWWPAADGACYQPDDDITHRLARKQNAHKGSFGCVAVLGGATGMTGAALLAARAALRTGAGKVRIGLLEPALAVDPLFPELMLDDAPRAIAHTDVTVVAIGPGLGQSPAAAQLLQDTLQRGGPLVLDADALNLIAADAGLADLCRTRGAATVITPHPAEAARLLGTSTEAVQSDRIAAVRQLASRLNAVALLKGCGTLVAGPDGFFTVNPTGHPGLAQAGQGDTLTGMIAALLAQGLSAGQAARHGAWLHGQTAGSIVAQSTRR